MTRITESAVEDAALDWLESLGWTVAHGPDIAPGTLCRNRKALTKTEVSTTALFRILPAFLVHDVQNLRFLSRRRFPSAYAHGPQQHTAFREPGRQISLPLRDS